MTFININHKYSSLFFIYTFSYFVEIRPPSKKGVPVNVRFSIFVVDINSINVEDMDFRWIIIELHIIFQLNILIFMFNSPPTKQSRHVHAPNLEGITTKASRRHFWRGRRLRYTSTGVFREPLATGSIFFKLKNRR